MTEPVSPFARVPDGVRVRIKVSPKAAQNRVGGIALAAEAKEAALKVGVTAAPEGGKANAQVIKLLAREWQLSRSRLHVTAGAASRGKTLLIEGDPSALLTHLNRWMEGDHD